MPEWHLDAAKFQNQLSDLATTIAYKVQREGFQRLGSRMAIEDIYVLLRLAQRTYDLFFYLNADEHRKEPSWRAYYTFVSLPLVRSMIDCLYNITSMLREPAIKPAEYRRSGYQQALLDLEEDETKYANASDPNYLEWLRRRRESLDVIIRRDGFTVHEIKAQKQKWPTLGKYLHPKGNVPLNDHQLFLKSLTFGYWREYSGYSHGVFQGLMETGMILLERDIPIEHRAKLDEQALRGIFVHMARAAAILLCILTEIQTHLRFDGARINERLNEIWDALLPAPEVKDLFDSRYAQLMHDKGIRTRIDP